MKSPSEEWVASARCDCEATIARESRPHLAAERAWPARSVRRLMRAVTSLLVPLLSLPLAAFGDEIPLEMWDDPKIEVSEPTVTFSPKLVSLWSQALEGPEVDLRRQAADNVLLALKRDMQEVKGMVEPLRKILRRPDLHPLVALSASRALVALDAREAADELFEHAKADGLDVAAVVEPALAEWGYEAIRPIWLERLKDRKTHRRRLMLAIDGLATVGESQAADNLLELALAFKAPVDVRLAASRSRGRIKPEGLAETSRQLALDKSPAKIVDRLIAANIIASHRDDASVELMMELAVDPEPAVAAIALATLLEIDPEHVVRIADETVASDDANVRRLGARAVVARPTVQRMKFLGPMLDDPHPDLRRYVRRSLETLAAQPELTPRIIDEASNMLSTDRWRGLEQATLLLTALDYKPAADRLVELLEFERPEVFIAAAWGLGQLAVPDTFAAMCEKSRLETEKALGGQGGPNEVERQVCHLNQALGRLKYAPCDEILRKYIPKSSPFSEEYRAGAIWGLGHLYAGKPDDELAAQLSARLNDVYGMMPEGDNVRMMSAVSIGRMKAEQELDMLRKYLSPNSSEDGVGFVCGWAINAITGEPMPEPKPREVSRLGWFLDPLEPQGP